MRRRRKESRKWKEGGVGGNREQNEGHGGQDEGERVGREVRK